MIYIITGATHVGKTYFAQKLLEKYNIPYVSIDHLKMGLIRSNNTNLTPYDDRKLTNYLWPIIREMIKTMIENKQNSIIEGCYIPSNWASEFGEEYTSNIKMIVLVMSNSYIDKNFSSIIDYESAIENRLYDSDITIDVLKSDNEYYFNSFNRVENTMFIYENDFSEIEEFLRRIKRC